MIRPNKKHVVPLLVLAIAFGLLIVTFWRGPGGDAEPSPPVSRRVTMAEMQERLKELQRTNPPREYSAAAAVLVGESNGLTSGGLCELGDAMLLDGHADLAELCFRKGCESDDAQESVRKIARLLYSTGRIDESRLMLTRLLKTGGLDLLSLPELGSAELTWHSDVDAIQVLDQESASFVTLLARAWIALRNHETERALSLLEIAERDATSSDSHQFKILKILILSQFGDTERLVERFSDQADPLLRHNADLLCIQGQVCRRLNQQDSAVRCFWEAFRLSPNNYLACAQLAELLEMQQESQVAAVFRERSTAIRDYEDICRQIHTSEFPTERQLGVAANTAAMLHCLRETVAWCRIAEQAYPEARWPREQIATVQPGIHPSDERFSQLYGWISTQTLGRHAWPDWQYLSQQLSTTTPPRDTLIVFEDDTVASGIQFQFEDDARSGSETTRLFEFTGGGVAVLDLDLDHWPDIFFTQGGTAPSLGHPDPSQASDAGIGLTDQLFRNIRGRVFENATEATGLTDGGYSQGCSSGDFDLDGFPDLYIANIGQNQLFHNNGDGTFSPVDLPSSRAWTTSCAIADVTNDGIPDLYDVNHVIAEGIHQWMCRREGVSVPCEGGSGLVAEQDRLFSGIGTGRFTDSTAGSGIETTDGLGLGVVILRLGEVQGLSIFVANDARPNFLFVNQGITGEAKFVEEAVLRGVALSRTGRAQACMGVATGDADGDGLTDLFVTNFFADYNTLYLQQQSAFFYDASEVANLVQSSYHQLGFGTQFLDPDLDGDLDLIVANGDVVDFSMESPDRPYAQRLQLFQNLSAGVFREQSADITGSLFQLPRLGRGLARLDWNNDGRADFVLTSVRSSAVLATNQTPPAGHFLTLRLVGTKSPRHPIGTIVQVITSDGMTTHQLTTHQLTAGDGYHACNQNALLIGTGAAGTLAIKIKWPSGLEHEILSAAADSSITVVEGLTWKVAPDAVQEQPDTANGQRLPNHR